MKLEAVTQKKEINEVKISIRKQNETRKNERIKINKKRQKANEQTFFSFNVGWMCKERLTT